AHRAVIKGDGGHSRGTGVRQSNIGYVSSPKFVQDARAESMDKVELEVGERILNGVGETAGALWQAWTKVIGLSLPIHDNEETVLITLVVIQPYRSLVAVE